MSVKNKKFKKSKPKQQPSDLFVQAVNRALSRLLLLGWRTNVGIYNKNYCGSLYVDYEANTATIYYNPKHNYTEDELIDTAYHEVAELLLSKFHHFIVKKQSKELIEHEKHAIIQRISYLLRFIDDLEKELKVLKESVKKPNLKKPSKKLK